MTFIAMVNIFLNTKSLQQEHTTDTKKNLLLQAVLPVTTIERVSDRLVELRVQIIISIKKIKFYTTYVSYPYRSMNHIVCIRNIDNEWITILVINTLYRNLVKVLCLVFSNLLAIHAQSLSEITETIQETNSTHINITVRSFLNVVTSKHTKTTRIDLQCRVNTILHTEVSYRWTSCIWLNIHVLTE